METDFDGVAAGATGATGARAATGVAETASVTVTAVHYLTSTC